MDIISTIITQLEIYATKIPIELFVLLGSFLEEIIAPIPSPFIMTLSGSIAKAQQHSLVYLLVLAIFGAFGKTIASWILYVIADKAEDIIITKYGKFFGVTHKEIESIGKMFNNSWKDNFFLFVARAIPIIPSAPISVVCGIIKLNVKTYILSTFLGTIVRNLLYLYVGFIGLSSFEEMMGGLDSLESVIQIIIALGIIGVILWAYYKRRTTRS